MNRTSLNWGLLSKYRTEFMGIAAAMILLFHITYPYYPHRFDFFGHSQTAYDLIGILNSGVEIFLLVSGIGLYFSMQKKPPIGSYLRKRALRLYIPYFLICSAPTLARLIHRHHSAPFLHWFLRMTGISFFINRAGYWYITFAMLTYLFYPLLYRWIFAGEKSERSKDLKTLFLMLCGAALCVAVLLCAPEYYNDMEVAFTRLPVFFLGVRLGEKVRRKDPVSLRWILLCTVWPAWKIVSHFFKSSMDASVYGLATRLSKMFFALGFLFLTAMLFEHLKTDWIKKTAAFLGAMSLELYLTHGALLQIEKTYKITLFPFKIGEWRYRLDYVLLLLLAVLLSWLFHLLIGAVFRRIDQRKNKAKVESGT